LFTSTEKLISFRNLKPKKKEGFLKVISIFSFLGIMLGVAILIIVMSVMNGFRTDLTNKLLGLNPHITIEPNAGIIDKKFENNLKKKYKEFIFSKSLTGEGIIITNNKTKGVIVKGIVADDTKIIFRKSEFETIDSVNLDKKNIIIGGELAYNLNLKKGDKLNLMSSALVNTPIGGVPKQETFLIKEIFNSGFYEFDQNLVYVNLNDALYLFDKDLNKVNLDVYLQEPLKANIFKKKIQKLNENLFVYSWSDLNKSFFTALKVERNVMFIILTLIIVVAAFNIISGLTILIKNKTREIAILKTLGLSNSSIKKSFFLTGFIIGFSATVFGIIFGLIFSFFIEEIRIFLSSLFKINIFPADVYFLDKMPSEINLISVLIVFLSSIIITSIASYIPANAISKMNITRALRYE